MFYCKQLSHQGTLRPQDNTTVLIINAVAQGARSRVSKNTVKT